LLLASGVPSTRSWLARYQAGITVSQGSIKMIRETLERLGAVLIDAQGDDGEGVRFKHRTKTPDTIDRSS
jgi:hypothetical protein